MKRILLSTIAACAAMTVSVAHADSVKRDMPACVSEDLFDELTTYSAKGDNDGIKTLFMSGKCTMLHRGDSVSVISPGFMVATIRYQGVKLFTASEAVR